ncbi:MAG: hypothetical protein HC831_00315 [Chloroflexia bacterium]|nr:hypothetical protein [Chloroflexia bacterium]
MDVRTGKVYEIPNEIFHKKGTGTSFTIPVYDSPVLILEKKMITPVL